MPFATTYVVPADEATYQSVKAELGDGRAAGLIAHLVTAEEAGGLRHTSVWESEEQWNRFRDERVGPAVGRVLAAAGMPAPARPVAEQHLRVVDVRVGG